MLQNLNKMLGKWMPLITPVSVIVGVVASTHLQHWTFVVPWIFAFMTFSGSLTSNFKTLQHTVAHPLPIFMALAILHILTPLWAYGIGHLFFSGDPLTITGFTLAVVIPTGITSVIWVTMYKGNLPLTLSIILIDTILSPIIVPVSMMIFIGESVEMNTLSIMKGLFTMIVLPSVIGMTLNQFTKPSVSKKISVNLAPFSKLSLPVVISINSSVAAPFLRNIDYRFFQILGTVLIIVLSGYLFSWILGILLKQKKENIIALIYTGGMRNISAGAVLAVSFFPPKVAVPVVICMLFQQILAAFHGQLITLYYDRPQFVNKHQQLKL